MSWRESLKSSMGSTKYDAWLGSARITETEDEVYIGLAGHWHVKYFRQNYGGMVRAAVSSQYPKAKIVIGFNSAVKEAVERDRSRKDAGQEMWGPR